MSEIKVNKISPRAACGTVQLGDSGDTFTIPAGATINNQGTATNFGATGAVSWNTTVKTGDFTAVAGEGYFVNTTSGAVNVTLPAGTPGAVVGIKDYANTFDTNAVTLVRNGSDKIGGDAINGTLLTEGISVTLVFIDSTQGWLVTDSGLQTDAPTALYVEATGGTEIISGNFKIHTFTGPGTFTVTCAGNPGGSTSVDYLVVAGGGGGGGWNSAGGGGGGGWRASEGTASGCYAAGPAPLVGCVSALPVSVQGYPITVGGGGAGGTDNNDNAAQGNTSTFSTISSAGGGGGGGQDVPGKNGGSGGGGGGGGGSGTSAGGSGNTPPVSPPQGNNGGLTVRNNNPGEGGGGGGAGTTGCNGVGPIPSPCRPASVGGDGANGASSSITASATFYAAGGGGASTSPGPSPLGNSPALGGSGGGGNGGAGPGATGGAGTVNTGSGGGGGRSATGGAGGSGVVIIRYKFQ
jgi:hypothetical protein